MKYLYNEKQMLAWEEVLVGCLITIIGGITIILIMIGITIFALHVSARTFDNSITIGARVVRKEVKVVSSAEQFTVEHNFLQGSLYERN